MSLWDIAQGNAPPKNPNTVTVKDITAEKTDPFIPTREDMHRMIKAFCSIHVENVKDDVGPNKPDAPFFERLAHAQELSWTDAGEMAQRFKKYTKTQLPNLKSIAGYPADTDWEYALKVLTDMGDIAVSEMKLLHDKMDEFYNLSTVDDLSIDEFTSEIEDYIAGEGLTYLGEKEVTGKVVAHYMGVNNKKAQINHHKTLQCERFTRVWYGKNDYNRRWPKQVPSISIKLPVRDNALYPTLKEEIGWPDFCYEPAPYYRMSIKDERSVIERALEALSDKFITTALRNMLADAPVGETETYNATFTARLYKDGVWLHIPYKEGDIRNMAKASGAKWQNASKEWAIPMRQVNVFVEKLPAGHALKEEISKIPEVATYLQGMAERVAISSAATLSDEERIAEMETRLTEAFNPNLSLYPFQYVGVRFAELANGRCVIGDDMGIGKTMQAIAYAALHPELSPVLVVCPAIVKWNWTNEIKKWVKDVKVQTVVGGNVTLDAGNDFYVINYDLMSKQKDAIESVVSPNLVIFDESHYLKNEKAKRTKACMSIAENADSVLCLSGTPITNRPKEFFTTLEMLRPSEWKGKKYEYQRRYCDGHKNDWGYWVADGSSNEAELHQMCRDFMIRRLKTEVLTELPDKVRQTHTVQPSAVEMREYVALRQKWVSTWERLRAQNKVPKGFMLNMLTELRKKCGSIKVSKTVEWIQTYKEQNEKPLVVFTHHLDVMEQIADELTDMNIELIHGGISAEKRTDIVANFQANEYDVLICSITAANMGITLTAADTVVFVEREWVPAYEEQAEDRILRIGATGDTVWATYLSVDGTIDQKFHNLVEAKRAVVKSIVDGGDVGERSNIANELLQSMVDAGEIPAEMLSLLEKKKAPPTRGAKKYD